MLRVLLEEIMFKRKYLLHFLCFTYLFLEVKLKTTPNRTISSTILCLLLFIFISAYNEEEEKNISFWLALRLCLKVKRSIFLIGFGSVCVPITRCNFTNRCFICLQFALHKRITKEFKQKLNHRGDWGV